ncbi:MAG: hypothetical protein Q9169_008371, partial [Polycauliona sp. 2 TL-2023]
RNVYHPVDYEQPPAQDGANLESLESNPIRVIPDERRLRHSHDMKSVQTCTMTPTFSSLPTELQDSILSHTLTLPFPIKFDPAPPYFHASHGNPESEVQKTLEILHLLPPGHEIFFHQNTFQVRNKDLSSFLAYTPASFSCTPITSPRDHITHLRTNMQPILDNVDVPALRELLSCTRLKKVEISVGDFFEGLCEFDKTFYRIKDVCLQLGGKLGDDEGLSVDLSWLYGRGRWTIKDFEDGVPPVG